MWYVVLPNHSINNTYFIYTFIYEKSASWLPDLRIERTKKKPTTQKAVDLRSNFFVCSKMQWFWAYLRIVVLKSISLVWRKITSSWIQRKHKRETIFELKLFFSIPINFRYFRILAMDFRTVRIAEKHTAKKKTLKLRDIK